MTLERLKRDDSTGQELWKAKYKEERLYITRPELGDDWYVFNSSRVLFYQNENFFIAVDTAEDLMKSKITNQV